MRLFFESLPILVAMFAVVFAAKRALLTRCKHVRRASFMGAVCAVLLIAAQTSWAWSVQNGNNIGEDIANHIWTIFNIAVMATLIYISVKATR